MTDSNPTTDIRRAMARYLRYERNCPLLALECPCRLASTYNDGGAADLLAVDNTRRVIEVEIKVSISDLRADRKKEKHEYFRKLQGMPYKQRKDRYYRYFGDIRLREPLEYPTHLFYYAFPKELVNTATPICDDLFPYAGILYPSISGYGYGNNRYEREFVAVKKKAKPLHPGRISLKQITILTKHQSGTLVRLLDEIDNWKKVAYDKSNN